MNNVITLLAGITPGDQFILCIVGLLAVGFVAAIVAFLLKLWS